MDNNQNLLDGTEVFKLAPMDIDHLFRVSGRNGNSLSPFRYNPEQASSSTPSESFKALTQSPKFQQIGRRLLEPDLRIEFHNGGGVVADDKYFALLSTNYKSVLAQFINSEGDILLLLFPDWETFLKWWIGVYASKGMGGYQTVFPNVMGIEVLVCALNCIDIYRRSYMESMLDYRAGVNLSLTTQDFVSLLKRSLASKDKRWLLPTMFEITPGLKNSSIALKPEHIQQVKELGFVTSHEEALTLDERSKIIGTEFITSWMGSIGWQATVLTNGEERSLAKLFMAITSFTNHLVSFETGANGDTRFRHQACTGPELIGKMSMWMEELQKVITNTAPRTNTVAPAESGNNSAPKAEVCKQCGTEIRPGKKFCNNCGKAV
ncbi:MAG: zinc ribbon domain-containing protein [Desulfosporosinus sp.]|nr:zinc ribbon domain-containing protein [Desulfosporosinus sp.]